MENWSAKERINNFRKTAVITGSTGMAMMIYVMIMTFFIIPSETTANIEALESLNYPFGISGMCLFGLCLYLEHKARQMERMQI